MSDPIAVVALLIACVAGAEWLGRQGPLRRLGPGILVIVLGSLLSNAGAVPSASTASPLYDAVFRVVAPLAIFLLLLDVRLVALRRAGGPMLIAFLLGSLGTMLGATAGMLATDVRARLGEQAGPLMGMFTATYVGGSTNFNAIALHYGVVNDSTLFVGATAVDAFLGTIVIVAILGLPAAMRRLGLTRGVATRGDTPHQAEAGPETAPMTAWSLAATLLLAFSALYLSERSAALLAGAGLGVPSILLLTTLALIVAQLPWSDALAGARILGRFTVTLFLAVIGVHVELRTVLGLGELAPTLLLFVGVLLVVHLLVLLAGGWLLKLDPDVLAMASNATVMGAATAPAVAESIGRHDLILPGILAGSLGTALGTYLGFAMAALL